MATGQTLLDTMELVNAELQLQSGESDVAKGLVALNRAQDYLESILASEKWTKGDTVGTVTTTASTETTAFPTGLLRLDRMYRLSATTSLPEAKLKPLREEPAADLGWPDSLYLVAGNSTGKTVAYWTNGRSIYWVPLPDATYTIRWYGFQAATDITASGTFLYDDILILPLASFAARLIKIGLDDDPADIATLAENLFRPAIKLLPSFQRDGARGLSFTQPHET